eukprot:3155396-Pleurochrysis_carterae.AAC.1
MAVWNTQIRAGMGFHMDHRGPSHLTRRSHRNGCIPVPQFFYAPVRVRVGNQHRCDRHCGRPLPDWLG